MLEKTEGEIHGNIGYTTHRTKTQHKTTTQKTKRWATRNPTKPVVNPVSRKGQAVHVFYRNPAKGKQFLTLIGLPQRASSFWLL